MQIANLKLFVEYKHLFLKSVLKAQLKCVIYVADDPAGVSKCLPFEETRKLTRKL